MSTHTDGATSPSVGGSDDDAGDGAAGSPAFGPDASPPRPRGPSAAGPGGPAGPGGSAAPPPSARSVPARPGPPPDAAHDGHAAGRNGPADSGWVQQEIQRRIAARGVSESGRHSRTDRARTTPGDDAGRHGGAPDDTPPPRPVAARTATPRPRSTRLPDPYAPDGMREQDGGPSQPEGPFRMPGPAAASPEPQGSPRVDPNAPPKQWPPAEGVSGLPRRVPGAGWTLDRRRDDGAPVEGGFDEIEPETRIVPALWAAAESRPATATVTRRALRTDVEDYDDDEDFEDDDLDDLDDLDFAPTGPNSGDTEVIWRAPGLDEPPVPAPPPMDGAPGPNPFTGVRPRAFAGAPTDLEPAPDVEQGRPQCPDLDDAPQGRRKRVVLSERRNVAHSVRTVVDVQDPGPVGSMWRSQLVSTQLRISLQVGGVALLGLFLAPALFAAFPSLGDVSLFGLRLPWLTLGFLIYPFLLGLGWWFVGSAERAEQDFIQEVQDR